MDQNLFLKQLKEGDKTSLEFLVKEYQKPVFRTCMAYVQNEHDAADLTQDVFIKALEKINQYKGDSKISTWLVRIAINLSLNFLRDNKRRLQNIELSDIHIISDEKDNLISIETRKKVREAIFNLNEKQRKVFILNFYLELSYQEITEITGYSLSAVESLLFRARKSLRKLLEDYYTGNISKTQVFESERVKQMN
ncbi:MAG: RNA polymerase sigma factor [Bacteroidales bacterium]|nr:RNA polymerase sigma factor [Bacteroidales bacterium]MBN2819195.1 RNA polymerase sigma factor [Bacteroidales bacterium]